jgi:succinate dehydrogenase/fumarate reductase flavoprotein subunit
MDHTADVVVIGSGASGFPAAIKARDDGASVILVEAQPHTGGHGTCSGGNVPLGGGTSRQKKYRIADSPDILFRDLTDWSIVEGNGFPDYRYNDREIIRAFADHSPIVFEFLMANGIVFVDKAPDNFGAGATGNSVPRENHAAVMNWPWCRPMGRRRPISRRRCLPATA